MTATRKHLMPFLALCVLLVAALVRWHQLGAQSLWYDEGVTYGHSLRSIPQLIEALQQNVHGPAYFALIGLWEDLVGHSEFALRAPSVLFSLLSVALTYALGKRLYGPLAGLAASALVALNTFSIYYAQEARMYAMLSAIAAASMLALVSFLERTCGRRWAGLALALLNALGIYTHYSYALVMLSQGLLALLWLAADYRADKGRAWRAFMAYCAANLLTIALFLPWLPLALSNISEQSNVAEAVPLDQMARIIQGWLAFGRTFSASITSGIGVAMYIFLIFGLLLLPGQPRRPRAWWYVLLPMLWALVSVGLFLLLALYTRYMRFLLPAQLAVALWMGRGVWALWHLQTRHPQNALRHAPKLAALLGLAVFLGNMLHGLDPLYRAPEHQRDNYRLLAQTLRAEWRTGDAIILNAASQQEVFCYYYACDEAVHLLPTSADDASTRAATEALIRRYRRIYAVFWGQQERDPNGIVESALNQLAYPISDEWFAGSTIRLVRYVMPSAMAAPVAVDVRFGEHITLQSYRANAQPLRRGDVLQLQLDWTTDAPLEARYKVFVQLLNPDGSLNSQRDSEPVGGQQPTTLWPVGATIVDNHALPIPSQLPAGEYRVIIGLYHAEPPYTRLPVGDGDYWEVLRFTVD